MKGYNKEISLKEVSFPAKFTFTKNEDNLYLKTSSGKFFFGNIIGDILFYLGATLILFGFFASINQRNLFIQLGILLCLAKQSNIKADVKVSSSGIEIISKNKSFFIEQNNISDFSIDTYFIQGTWFSKLPCYKIIINCKRAVKMPKIFGGEKEKLELFGDDKFVSKLTVFFLIQEFSKVLNLSLNLEEKQENQENQDIEDVPNFCNFDVIKNDNLNLTIKRRSVYDIWTVISIAGIVIIGLWFLFYIASWFYNMAIRDVMDDFSLRYMMMISPMMCFGVYFLYICAMFNFYKKSGRYISIDSDQIAISKLQFIKSKPSNTEIIKIDRHNNITIGINELESAYLGKWFDDFIKMISSPFRKKTEVILEKNNFELVLYKNNSSRIVLIDKITKREAEYLIYRMIKLANKYDNKLSISNTIIAPQKKFSYKFIFVLLFAIFFIFGIPYSILKMAEANADTIRNPELLDKNLLRHLGYTYKEVYALDKEWRKNNKVVDSIDIPSSYKYKKQEYHIKEIGERCFSESKNIKTVSISEGITTIGYMSFVGCDNLKEIKIPTSVKIIKSSAFYWCKSLEKIELPQIKRIDDYTFWHCTSLNLKIPDSVTEIGKDAFLDVPHIEYHGKAKGAPWGAKSMN